MLSYRFMHMSMDGNRSDTEGVSPATVLQSYMVTPTQMPMGMHMFGAMLAPSDVLTLMAMVPFMSSHMDHQTRAGGQFTTESSGLGDIKLTGLVRLFSQSRKTAHFVLGVSAPTGSVEERDVTPMSAPNEVVLPYPMQVGSGTWDLLGGVTLLGQGDRASWGLQVRGTRRLGENDRGYTLGHRGLGTAWGAFLLNDWFSLSARVEGSTWGDIEGADATLNPIMSPTADPGLRRGKRADVGVGLNFEVRGGALNGQRLAVELTRPVWQDLDAPPRGYGPSSGGELATNTAVTASTTCAISHSTVAVRRSSAASPRETSRGSDLRQWKAPSPTTPATSRSFPRSRRP